ncbi:uncharacterized protein OCT59_020167 [Rhizophagus irregularis]|uniref:uncharacterized protein n=1 Tax=Rhizophagus irregularis TaxID=588596 RepID=UPI003333EEE0|nr:hypothetical protein OCT59_020167 [Rhizophagus irregularis]
MSTTRKRTILSAAQKCEICEIKEREPNLSNVSLAQRYNIGKSTVTDILSEKERWLAILGDQGSIKKFRGPKWPRLEQALGLWVDNALNTRQDIDGNILKVKAAFFAERFSIEDFHQSEAYDNVQDGFVEKLADYNIFEALQNSAEACIEDEEVELENLIAFLPEGDHLNAREYINIEDEIAEGALTDDEIIDAILNADKEEEIVVEENELMPIMEKVSLKEAEKAVNNITQFLYEQGSEFGDVNDELKILKGLHKRIKLLIVRNLKQLNLNNFRN